MNCDEFRKQMNNFIQNNIDEDIIEDFIVHYKNCKNCNEELEIYYMIDRTFNSDMDKENTVNISGSFDFKKRLHQKILYYEDMIYHKYKINFLLRLLLLGTNLISFIIAIYFIIFIFWGNYVR